MSLIVLRRPVQLWFPRPPFNRSVTSTKIFSRRWLPNGLEILTTQQQADYAISPHTPSASEIFSMAPVLCSIRMRPSYESKNRIYRCTSCSITDVPVTFEVVSERYPTITTGTQVKTATQNVMESASCLGLKVELPGGSEATRLTVATPCFVKLPKTEDDFKQRVQNVWRRLQNAIGLRKSVKSTSSVGQKVYLAGPGNEGKCLGTIAKNCDVPYSSDDLVAAQRV